MFQISNIIKKMLDYPEIDDVISFVGVDYSSSVNYIYNCIKKSDVFLLFWSKNALESKNVEIESQAAIRECKEIVYVLLQHDVVPTFLKPYLSVLFQNADFNNTIDELYKIILKTSRKEYSYFRGVQIKQFEKKILNEIEMQTKNEFKKVDKIEHKMEMSFSIENYQVTGISLYKSKLKNLPESIGKLQSLLILDLDWNRLKSLPESITQLRLLQALFLSINNLTNLPESIGNLTSLQSIDLSINELTILPESIGKLQSLLSLYLNGNYLTSLPESITQLKSLQTLSLSGNKLNKLPESIGNLKFLSILDLGDNKLTSLPESIRNLHSLIMLALDRNQLTTLPESICNLESLGILYLNENNFLTLPESVKKLEQKGVTVFK